MLYFDKLPNHRDARFDEQSHFAKFQKQNIIFNAIATKSHCEEHVGCFSIKTVWSGTEAYRFQSVQRKVTPGQFLILNNDQSYSSSIDSLEKVESLSVFFSNEFAAEVFRDAQTDEQTLLDNYDQHSTNMPEFFQTLYAMDVKLETMLKDLASKERDGMDERLVFVLRHLLTFHRSETNRSRKVDAIKATTKKEIYRRLCIARDVLYSSYADDLDLETISQTACMSTPQFIRQFKTVFNITPHQYRRNIRLEHAAIQLRKEGSSVLSIATSNGFENVSAFCRAFKQKFGVTPQSLRGK